MLKPLALMNGSDSPLWQPSKERIAAANLTRFMREVEALWGVRCADYAALYGPAGEAATFRGRPPFLALVGATTRAGAVDALLPRFPDVSPADWRRSSLGGITLAVAPPPARPAP